MTIPKGPRLLVAARGDTRPDAPGLKRKLLVAVMLLALACLVILGGLRLLESRNADGVNAWRLALFLADGFFCVNIICALYARGRQPRRRGSIGARRY